MAEINKKDSQNKKDGEVDKLANELIDIVAKSDDKEKTPNLKEAKTKKTETSTVKKETATSKKTTVKKASKSKVENVKKTTPKKTTPKKTIVKKTAPKKTIVKKTAPKKDSVNNTKKDKEKKIVLDTDDFDKEPKITVSKVMWTIALLLVVVFIFKSVI